MKTSKLFTILRTFSDEEMKRLEKFISSPFHNNGRNFKPIYSYLKKLHPDFPQKKLTDEAIFRKLYPGKKYDLKTSSKNIKVILSRFTKLTEEYLIIKNLGQNETYRFSALMDELTFRKLYKMGDSILKDHFNKQTEYKDESSYFLDKYMSSIAANRFFFHKPKISNKKIVESIQEKTEALIYMTIFEIINYRQNIKSFYYEDFTESDLIKNFYEISDIDNLLKEVYKEGDEELSRLTMLFYFYRITVDFKDEKSYEIFKKLVLKYSDKLSFEIKKNYLHGLCNFCFYQELRKRDHYMSEFSKIYNILLDESVKARNIELFTVINYRNMIRLYASENKFGDIKEYNSKYLIYHDPEERDNLQIYSNALMSFQKKNFEDTLSYINRTNFSIPMMIRDMKYLKMQVVIELGYYDLFNSELDSFRHFLSNSSEIPVDFIKNDRLVLNYFKSYMKYKESEDENGRIALLNDLKALNTENIYLRWLLEKLTKN